MDQGTISLSPRMIGTLPSALRMMLILVAALAIAACGSDSELPAPGDGVATDATTGDGVATGTPTGDGVPTEISDTDGVPTEITDTDGVATDPITDSCPSGETECGDDCVDTDTSASHCGACDNPCDLANADEACIDGLCAIDECDEGWASCDNDDATGCNSNLRASSNNCGECGSVCELTNAIAECEDGDCTFISCDGEFDEDGDLIGTDFGNCDGDEETGCEVTLTTDPMNCGECGRTAADASNVAEAGCDDGVPTIEACDPGFANCDGDWNTGCEASTSADDTCGSSCVDCTGLGGAGVEFTCSQTGGNFVCSGGGCAAGQADCDGDGENCETDILTDADNCGGCGTECSPPANASAICDEGSCDFECDAGFERCGDQCVDTNTNDDFCGSCTNSCANSETCTGGTCTCASGFTNCDGDCVDSFDDNVNHCGECGNACGVQGPCADGSCRCDDGDFFCQRMFGSSTGSCCNETSEVCEQQGAILFRTCHCADGYTDCSDAGEARDCRNLNTDRSNCGTCGNSCPLLFQCRSGSCVPR